MKCHVWIALSTPDSSTACWLRWGGLSVVLPIRYNSSSRLDYSFLQGTET